DHSLAFFTNVSAIAHQKLWLSFTNTGGTYPAMQVWIDDFPVTNVTGSSPTFTLSIAAGTPSVDYLDLHWNTNFVYVVPLGFGGDGSGRMVEFAFKDFERLRASGVKDQDPRLLSASLYIIGQTWLRETDLHMELVERLSGERLLSQIRAGIAAQ